jgi:hypothetical protein
MHPELVLSGANLVYLFLPVRYHTLRELSRVLFHLYQVLLVLGHCCGRFTLPVVKYLGTNYCNIVFTAAAYLWDSAASVGCSLSVSQPCQLLAWGLRPWQGVSLPVDR